LSVGGRKVGTPARGGQLGQTGGERRPAALQARFRAQLTAIPADIEVLSLRELAWPMAELQYRHRSLGHRLSATMVEALASAHRLDASIAVSRHDVGPNLQAAAHADGVDYHIL
jgi:hypothetical protein